MSAPSPIVPAGSLWQRLRGRLRHGLLLQEVLEALAARGFVCLPYIVVLESLEQAIPPTVPPGVSVRELDVSEAASILEISVRAKTLEDIRRTFDAARCFGAFLGPSLIGHTWARTSSVPMSYGGGPLFELAPDEAYLFDTYVDPRHRGLRVAPYLWSQVLRLLAAEGRRHCYSLSYVFNRSSRAFKARLGAHELEWRLALHLDMANLPGLDVRLFRCGPPLRTAWLRRRRSKREFADGR